MDELIALKSILTVRLEHLQREIDHLREESNHTNDINESQLGNLHGHKEDVLDMLFYIDTRLDLLKEQTNGKNQRMV